MTKHPPQSRQEAADQSRQRLLQAGLELLGQKLGSPFDNIRSTEVARAAGFTPGAFYHHWPSQDDYRKDLRSHIGGQGEADQSLERIGKAFASGATSGMANAIRAVCRSEITTQVAGPSWHVQLAMLASQHEADLDESALQYQSWYGAYGEFYAELFELLGVELVPEVNLQWFVRTMGALVEGYSLQIRSGLSESVEGLADNWQACELAVAMLITSVLQRTDGKAITAQTIASKLEQLTQ